MKTHWLFSIVACAFTSGCAHVAGGAISTLRPSDLNSKVSTYDGRDVVVQGYVTLEPEGHTLYESKALFDEFGRRWDAGKKDFEPNTYDKYCLTIANPELLYDELEVFAKKTITVKGKFEANYMTNRVDFGACPLPTAIVIDEADLKRRYQSIFSDKVD